MGANFTEANPLEVLATILPVVPVVMSETVTVKPRGVSNRCTLSRSPLRMKKSLLERLNRALSSGLDGAVAFPFLVRKAKFTGSIPAVFRQAVLLGTFVFSLIDSESMFRAAHHLVPSQLLPTGHLIQPGG